MDKITEIIARALCNKAAPSIACDAECECAVKLYRDQAKAAKAALEAAGYQIVPAESTPEDTAEQFIQAAIDRAPEPLRRLGEWLANVLDEDEWPTAERMLLGAAEAMLAAAGGQNNG